MASLLDGVDDTTGSVISGSFVNYPPLDEVAVDGGMGMMGVMPQVISDLSPSLLEEGLNGNGRFSLHAIEEERASEVVGSLGGGGGSSRVLGMNNSATMAAIVLERGTGSQKFIPRSISQQLEMMDLG